MSNAIPENQNILDLIDTFNSIESQASLSSQLEIQASGKITVNMADGGYVGNIYIGTFAHNLGYAPMFIAYYAYDPSNFYRVLPYFPHLDGGGASIKQGFYAYADATNLYVRWTVYVLPGQFGQPDSNGPMYPPSQYPSGVSRTFPFFLFKNPILTN